MRQGDDSLVADFHEQFIPSVHISERSSPKKSKLS
jgi:hypothetical protein